MAINLWTLGGKTSSYNPLPTSWGNYLIFDRKSVFIVTLKAKSASNASLRITGDVGSDKVYPLSNEFKHITHEINGLIDKQFYLYDHLSRGDIIIQDIQLVEKPLGLATINGIDGFLSGKWNLHTNARVIDDETLELNATTSMFEQSRLDIPIKNGTSYVIDLEVITGGRIACVFRDSNMSSISTTLLFNNAPLVLVSPNNATTLSIIIDNNQATGTFTFKKPMLNLGSIPAPYEKKKGDRMVMPVERKNHFDGKAESGYYGISNGAATESIAHMRTISFIPVMKEKTINLILNNINHFFVHFYDGNKNYISSKQYTNTLSCNLNEFMPINAAFVRFHFDKNTFPAFDVYKTIVFDAVQLNNKPKVILPPARKGLVMDGVTNYVQLPAMMMDSVEIDFLMDVEQKQVGFYLMDARMGGTNCYMYRDNVLGVGFTMLVNGTPSTSYAKGVRNKVKLNATTPFTDDVVLFSAFSGAASTEKAKGTLYGVKCYLNGQVVAEYDFTNPNNIIGDKVLQKSKNLIPSFDSGKWTIHPVAKVLGKDTIRIDATFNYQNCLCDIPIVGGKTYLLGVASDAPARITGSWYSGSTFLFYTAQAVNGFVALTAPVNATMYKVALDNALTTSGSYVLSKPQLYELDGKEGTIYGNPQCELKAAKRVLFAKR
jgi:hypothetical protein